LKWPPEITPGAVFMPVGGNVVGNMKHC
jgi:hypothetical protein